MTSSERVAPSAPSDGLLAGLRVLDLSRVLSGPMVGRVLRDLGADVVKLEPPEGDVTRLWGKSVGGLSGYYTQQNVGKRNVAVDLTKPGGPELVGALAQQADVVVENFRPRVLARFGLDYATLQRSNPRLVMLSISGFGQSGRDSSRGAYAPIIHAESGFIARQADMSHNDPADFAMGIGDVFASLHGLVGILASVLAARETGRGQHVDISMLHAMCFTDDWAHFSLDGFVQERGVSEIWPTSAGPVLISGHFALVWKSLARAHGLDDGCSPDAELGEKIVARRKAAGVFLLALADRGEVVAALDRADLIWGDVREGDAVYDAPGLVDRGAVRTIDDRAGGERRILDSPYRFSDASSGIRGPAPYLGEHNAEVLGEWLTLDAEAVAGLRRRDVLVESADSAA